MKAQFVFLMIIASFIMSCQSSTDNVKKIIIEWQGKKMVIPSDEIKFKILGKDTICLNIIDMNYKILTYVDSVGCTSCRLDLPQWKQLIDSCHNCFSNVGFLFVIHSTNFKIFEQELIISNFNYPVIFDFKNSFDKLNHFPPFPYQTFLLDKDNNVLLVGSPVNNPKMWELYKKTIEQKE